MIQNFVVATIKPWNIANFKKYFGNKKNYYLIQNKEKLTLDYLREINPRYIFFPHWSWLIPKKILSNYECVIFHAANLPYGRGGSPIQNMILKGFTTTHICALKATAEIDAGPIFLRRTLSLTGSAEDIFRRLSHTVFFDMIPYIIKHEPMTTPQIGKVTLFKRRTPEESDIEPVKTLSDFYDFIRMLDAPKYPKAFLKTKRFRLEFSKVRLHKNKLTARVEVYEK